jgi:hypothetical protein
MLPTEKVHVVVNDNTIATGDDWAVIEPVWWLANIYDGPGAYEQSLQPFSQSQRYVFAVRWYHSEVNNGGHLQFYSNSTGIVWQDALNGLEAMGLEKAANILRISADRLGGSPSLDRQERQDQLDEHQPDFEDCDEAFYKLQERVDFEEITIDFIRHHPSDFYFVGTIERIVLPKLRSSEP